MALLLNRSVFKGYGVGTDVVDESNFSDLETTASPNTETTVGYVDIEDDEFYRLGQGQDRGPEYTRGRLYIELDDGAGNPPDDSSRLELVELSSQNNVKRTFWSGKYGPASAPAGDGTERTQRIPLPEEGMKILAGKRSERLGLRVKSGSGSTYTVDFSASNIQLDVIRGER